jgi:hypothetical protein
MGRERTEANLHMGFTSIQAGCSSSSNSTSTSAPPPSNPHPPRAKSADGTDCCNLGILFAENLNPHGLKVASHHRLSI